MGRRFQEGFKLAPVGMLGLLAAILYQLMQIRFKNILHGK
jgi:hypothetical protein